MFQKRQTHTEQAERVQSVSKIIGCTGEVRLNATIQNKERKEKTRSSVVTRDWTSTETLTGDNKKQVQHIRGARQVNEHR